MTAEDERKIALQNPHSCVAFFIRLYCFEAEIIVGKDPILGPNCHGNISHVIKVLLQQRVVTKLHCCEGKWASSQPPGVQVQSRIFIGNQTSIGRRKARDPIVSLALLLQ